MGRYDATATASTARRAAAGCAIMFFDKGIITVVPLHSHEEVHNTHMEKGHGGMSRRGKGVDEQETKKTHSTTQDVLKDTYHVQRSEGFRGHGIHRHRFWEGAGTRLAGGRRGGRRDGIPRLG